MNPTIQAFLAGITLADVLTWLGAAGALFATIKWVIPFARKLSHFIDDVAGEPARAGVPARPGLMERVTTIEERTELIEKTQTEQGESLETVRHELFPNSGKSLRDQTNRMEQKLDADNEKIGELSERIDSNTTRLDEHIEQSEQIIQQLKEKP